jgi:hypothetical protein
LPGSLVLTQDALSNQNALYDYFNDIQISVSSQASALPANMALIGTQAISSTPTSTMHVDFGRGETIPLSYGPITQISEISSALRHASSGYNTGSSVYSAMYMVDLSPAFEQITAYAYDQNGYFRANIWNNLEVVLTIAAGQEYYAGKTYIPKLVGHEDLFTLINPSASTASSGGVQSVPSPLQLASSINYVLSGSALESMFINWVAQTNSLDYGNTVATNGSQWLVGGRNYPHSCIVYTTNPDPTTTWYDASAFIITECTSLTWGQLWVAGGISGSAAIA